MANHFALLYPPLVSIDAPISLFLSIFVSQEETSGATALVMALQRYDWVLARRFIEEGASVNIPTYSGYYPLHYAAQAVNMPMVKLLISHEAEMGSKAVECPDVSEISREVCTDVKVGSKGHSKKLLLREIICIGINFCEFRDFINFVIIGFREIRDS